MKSIHNPTVKVKIGSDEIEIRELSWPDALHLYHALLAQTKSFIDEEGKFAIDPQKVVGAITENIELGEWLVMKSAGKNEDWLKERSLSEFLDLASEAAVLNIGIIVTRLKNAGSRLREIVAGAKETLSSKPSDSTANSPTSRSS